MTELHPAARFVHDFHALLTQWFSGAGERAATFAALEGTCAPDMSLLYPSGSELSGDQFLSSIRELHGSSPGFEARIDALELVHAGPDHAAVRYVEAQVGAKNSSAANHRSAFALIVRAPGDPGGGPGSGEAATWRWRHIQETDLPQAR